MMWSRWKLPSGFLLAAMLSSPLWGSIPPQPGVVNYIEGQAAINGQPVTQNSVGSTAMAPGQTLATQNGRAEVLLTPGVFLRIDSNSAIQMVSPGIADTVVALQKGRAMVDAADVHKANNIRVTMNGFSTQLQKAGLYEFDADHNTVRVFDGKAVVNAPDKQVELSGSHQLTLAPGAKLKAQKFDKKEFNDGFYRWASLRSSYLAEANVDAARRYAGGSGWAPSMWYGAGWYWDPWYTAYTWIPGDGIFYDPFGWGFYSPWMAFGAPYPYLGFGYYGGGYYGGYHHFGPGYRPPVAVAGNRGIGAIGHAYSLRGPAAVGSIRGGGFSRGGGYNGFAARSGFAGRGFGGSGFGAGGFHGGGRR